MTKIEWCQRPGTTGEAWNPVTGCTKVSEGCRHCYAETFAHRQMGPWKGRAFTEVQCHEDRLDAPLHWRSPRTVFVNSMSDLFHLDVPDAFIDRVFAVMALCPQHTFIVLTKRPERMRKYVSADGIAINRRGTVLGRAWEILGHPTLCKYEHRGIMSRPWPLPNVWMGVSCEDQPAYDKRIGCLLRTPAAVRLLSLEPLLGAINLRMGGMALPDYSRHDPLPKLDWLIIGGESGPHARPCDVVGIRSLVQQGKAAGVPVFVKQLGANIHDRNDAGFMGEGPDEWPIEIDQEDRIEHLEEGYQGAPVRVHLHSRKGADIAEWPEDLRVREWPR